MLAAYLVMKNNLKRYFQSKMTYILVLIIPILISIIGIISTNLATEKIKIGSENLVSEANIEKSQFVKIEKDSIHTDYIMGKYDYVLQGTKEDTKNIQEIIENKINKTGLTGKKQLVALLITAYLVIATLYASKQIVDQSTKTLQRFCYAGNKKIDYLLGTFLSTGIIVFLEVNAALLIFYFIAPDFSYSIIEIIGLGLKITAITSIFASVLSQITHSEMSANLAASFFSIFSSIIGGTFIAVDAMPKLLQLLSILSPIRWLISG